MILSFVEPGERIKLKVPVVVVCWVLPKTSEVCTIFVLYPPSRSKVISPKSLFYIPDQLISLLLPGK